MSQARVKRSHGWTAVPNAIMRDGSLRLVSKVLYSLLAGFSADFKFSRRTLESMTGSSRDTVQAGLKELEVLGYLTRERSRGDGGRWVWTYELHDSPQPVLPVPVQPAPVPPVPVKPVILRRPEERTTEQEDHVQGLAGASQALGELFLGHGRGTSTEIMRELILTARAIGATPVEVQQTAHDVLTELPRAKTAKVVSYVIERLTDRMRSRGVSVGLNTFSERPHAQVRELTEEEKNACIPFH